LKGNYCRENRPGIAIRKTHFSGRLGCGDGSVRRILTAPWTTLERIPLLVVTHRAFAAFQFAGPVSAARP
jgi:hypothetical protein